MSNYQYSSPHTPQVITQPPPPLPPAPAAQIGGSYNGFPTEARGEGRPSLGYVSREMRFAPPPSGSAPQSYGHYDDDIRLAPGEQLCSEGGIHDFNQKWTFYDTFRVIVCCPCICTIMCVTEACGCSTERPGTCCGDCLCEGTGREVCSKCKYSGPTA